MKNLKFNNPDVTNHVMPPSPCTACGKVMDRAGEGPFLAGKPRPGDISICMHCSHIMAFDDNLMLRDLTEAEVVECAGEPELLWVMALLGKYRKYKQEKSNGRL